MDDYMISNQRNRRPNNTILIRDAKIEEIFTNRSGNYVKISYGIMGDFNMIHMNILILVVGRNTIIQNQLGQHMTMRDLEEGMLINAEISSVMTASIPPQARAYRIVVLNESENADIKVGRVISVDTENGFLIIGNANDISSQIRFVINDATLILDRRGNRICLCDIRLGQMVRVKHANFMTFSIPPQTTAFKVQIV